MKIGIDGNMWYCSNGLPLQEYNSKFTFERTLKEAVEKFHATFKNYDPVPEELLPFWNCTPEQYKEKINGN